MLRWLKKRIESASTDAIKKDLERFIISLQGADDEEIAPMLVTANILRIRFIDWGIIPLAALDMSINRDADLEMKCDMCPIRLNGMIKQFQKNDNRTDALGTMIWLHSVRALNVPEARMLGRQMWGELVRGFQFIDQVLEQVRKQQNWGWEPLPESIDGKVRFVPRGLEPIEKIASKSTAESKVNLSKDEGPQELLERYPNAQIAIKYRDSAKQSWSDISDLPTEYQMKFLQALEIDPKSETAGIAYDVRLKFDTDLNPFDTAEMNKAFASARKVGHEAAEEFRRVADTLGASVSPDGLLKKVKAKFSPRTQRKKKTKTVPRSQLRISLEKAIKNYDENQIIEVLKQLGYVVEVTRQQYHDNTYTIESPDGAKIVVSGGLGYLVIYAERLEDRLGGPSRLARRAAFN